ncbi:DUF1810 domain-containing protein [Lichenicoccus sp.]|uniref:DUF1810 domain-containing protein n=1 Tax=Lichenicoccus sp. TaxID=2781899 RepID=UPI003D0F2B0F
MAAAESPLQRFVDAQDRVLEQVLRELRQGRKRTHWMWFVFPQLAGLGHSAMAQHYAIASLDEARAYLAHPLLGPRLATCTDLVCAVRGRSIDQILGSPDDLKFRSSMTLFSRAQSEDPRFQDALDRYFAGRPDLLTITRL